MSTTNVAHQSKTPFRLTAAKPNLAAPSTLFIQLFTLKPKPRRLLAFYKLSTAVDKVVRKSDGDFSLEIRRLS